MGRRGPGEGSIFYRKDRKRWFGQVSLPDGKQRQTRACKTKSEARAERDKMLRALAAGQKLDSGDATTTVEQYLEKWLADAKPQTKPSTWEQYHVCLRRVIVEIGHMKLSKLNASHIKSMQARLLERYAPKTVQTTQIILCKVLNEAVRLDVIAFNPGKNVSLPYVPPREVKTMEGRELRPVLEEIHGTRWYAFFLLMMITGMRSGEVRGLMWDEIDVEKRMLRVVRQSQWQKGKGTVVLPYTKSKASRRVIRLDPRVIEALEEHRRIQQADRERAGDAWLDTGLVFTRKTDGGPLHPSAHKGFWERALDRAGVPKMRPHDLRHNVGSELLRHGHHMKVVQELLGHADIKVTMGIYSHVADVLHEAAVTDLASLLVPEHKPRHVEQTPSPALARGAVSQTEP